MSAPASHDPLFVNTAGGQCWKRQHVDGGGRGLYALADVVACPAYVLASFAELAELGISGSADVLPMPAGPASAAPGVDPRVELIRRERTHCEAAQFESEDERPLHVWGPSQYPKREMCQRCTVTREWAEDSEATDVVLLAEVDRLRSEVASLNESLSVAAERMRADRDRIAELEALTPARVQTCRVCGAGYTYGESCSSCEFRKRMAAELQARGLDGEHYPYAHHSYRVPRDLPETGGTQ